MSVQVTTGPLTPIGDLRRKLFMPYDCEWNGYIRDITARFEMSGGLVSEETIYKIINTRAAVLTEEAKHAQTSKQPEGATSVAMQKEKWLDISVELERTYIFHDGSVTIKNPKTLHVSNSSLGGHAHRVTTTDGKAYYIAPGWMAIEWKVAEGEYLFKF